MSVCNFKERGVWFAFDAAWRYVIAYRYPPNRYAHAQPWHDFHSFAMPNTAHHVFTTTRKQRGGADVYLVDTDRAEVLAHAYHGAIVFGTDTDNESES